jgi:hypothetical protein
MSLFLIRLLTSILTSQCNGDANRFEEFYSIVTTLKHTQQSKGWGFPFGQLKATQESLSRSSSGINRERH